MRVEISVCEDGKRGRALAEGALLDAPGVPKRDDFEWVTACLGTEHRRRVRVAGALARRAGLA